MSGILVDFLTMLLVTKAMACLLTFLLLVGTYVLQHLFTADEGPVRTKIL